VPTWTGAHTWSATATFNGSVVGSTATGGAQGAGSVNATALYVNGTAVNPRITQNLQTGTTYATVLSDNGKHIYGTNTSAKTFTVSPSVHQTGDSFYMANGGSGTMSIAPGAGVTLVLTGTGTTGTRTLAGNGLALILCIAANTFMAANLGGLT
jgi:hypothetical protein